MIGRFYWRQQFHLTCRNVIDITEKIDKIYIRIVKVYHYSDLDLSGRSHPINFCLNIFVFLSTQQKVEENRCRSARDNPCFLFFYCNQFSSWKSKIKLSGNHMMPRTFYCVESEYLYHNLLNILENAEKSQRFVTFLFSTLSEKVENGAKF